MAEETYKPVPTLIELPHKCAVVAVRDDEEGFRVVLQPEDGGDFYRISFPVVLFYRKSREGERLKSLETLVNTSSQKAILHAVEDSRLAKWFDQENLELKGYSGVTGCPHWAIVTQNDWIDVLSYTAPLVERLA